MEVGHYVHSVQMMMMMKDDDHIRPSPRTFEKAPWLQVLRLLITQRSHSRLSSSPSQTMLQPHSSPPSARLQPQAHIIPHTACQAQHRQLRRSLRQNLAQGRPRHHGPRRVA